jgi:dTDP-4-dehydrorhamnose 3,5-epimerase
LRFSATTLHGAKVIEFDRHVDERGTFRRVWSEREAKLADIERPIVQSSLSVTKRRGTLRGMHFQLAPSREDKIVQCVRGRIFDVALDLRRSSPTYLQHFGVELSEESASALFIPAGCAHGFLTRTEDCGVLYMMTDYYDSSLSTGVRWNDPAFAIAWPEQPLEMLERDRSYPDFNAKTVDGFAAYR